MWWLIIVRPFKNIKEKEPPDDECWNRRAHPVELNIDPEKSSSQVQKVIKENVTIDALDRAKGV